jgi:lipopolysaccharide heptosyltransferase II
VTPTAVIQVKPGIGDVLWHLPFIRAIAAAAPGGQVTFLAPPTSLARELLVAEPAVAATLYFAHRGNELQRGLNLLRLIRLLRQQRFRTLWILDRTLRPAVAGLLAGIPERVGLGLTIQRFLISNAGIDQSHFHDSPIDCLKELMLTQNLNLSSTEPNLPLPADALAAVDRRFGQLPRPWLVLGLGASHRDKDWPDRHWRDLLRQLAATAACSVLLIGGPAQAARARRLVEESAASAINACDLPVIQSAALLKRADLYAGPDSGPLNLAAAVGTPAYGLFSWTPLLRYSRFIHAVHASDDPAPTRMDAITPERLLAALAPALAAAASR